MHWRWKDCTNCVQCTHPLKSNALSLQADLQAENDWKTSIWSHVCGWLGMKPFSFLMRKFNEMQNSFIIPKMPMTHSIICNQCQCMLYGMVLFVVVWYYFSYKSIESDSLHHTLSYLYTIVHASNCISNVECRELHILYATCNMDALVCIHISHFQ